MECHKAPVGQDPRELIPIFLGFERLGELLSHLHPQRLQAAAEANRDVYLRAKDSGKQSLNQLSLSPWPNGESNLPDGCEDPDGLVAKYVEQSVAWAAMIVSRSRSMFVAAHFKQKRSGAAKLLHSLERVSKRRVAITLGTWRHSSYVSHLDNDLMPWNPEENLWGACVFLATCGLRVSGSAASAAANVERGSCRRASLQASTPSAAGPRGCSFFSPQLRS